MVIDIITFFKFSYYILVRYVNGNYFSRNMYPSFVNIIKPKKTITSKLFQKDSLKTINNFINNAQKVINVYDQAMPIINQVKPMVGNLRTTLKVAKAFKRFSKESPLEKAFDDLPDFEQTIEKTNEKEKQETINKVANPFYP